MNLLKKDQKTKIVESLKETYRLLIDAEKCARQNEVQLLISTLDQICDKAIFALKFSRDWKLANAISRTKN